MQANTVLLTVFNGILAFVAIRQWLNFRTQEKHTLEALALTRDTTQRELRAYLHISDTKCEWGEQVHPKKRTVIAPTIQIKNFGQTPAYRTMALFGQGAFEFPAPKSLPPPIERPGAPLVAPGAIIEFDLGDQELTPDAIDDCYKHKTRSFYVYGRIEYFDAFGAPHWTEFRFCLDPHNMKSVRLTMCRSGNDTD